MPVAQPVFIALIVSLLAPQAPARAIAPCSPVTPLQLAPEPPGESVDLDTSSLDLERAMTRLSSRTLVTSGLAPLAANLGTDRHHLLAKRCSDDQCELVLALFEGQRLRQTRVLRTRLAPDVPNRPDPANPPDRPHPTGEKPSERTAIDLVHARVSAVDFEGDGRKNLLAVWYETDTDGRIHQQMQAFYPDLSPLSPLITPRHGQDDRAMTLIGGCTRRQTLEIQSPGAPPTHLPWPLKTSP